MGACQTQVVALHLNDTRNLTIKANQELSVFSGINPRSTRICFKNPGPLSHDQV